MKKTARLGLRVTPQEKIWWEAAAKEQGFNSTAAWISSVLNNAATQKMGKSPTRILSKTEIEKLFKDGH